MKCPKRFTPLLFLAVIVAAAFFFLNEKEAPSPGETPMSVRPVSAGSSTAQVPAPPPNEQDPWTVRLIESRVADESKMDRAAIQAFNEWAYAFAAGESSARDDALADALAPIRRAGLKELIKKDPAAAWDAMLPDEVRASLPSSLQPFLEEPVSGSGDWEVYSACFWEHDEPASEHASSHTEAPTVIQKAVFEASRYDAFPVGPLVGSATRRDINLEGFAIDDTAVFQSASTETDGTAELYAASPYTEGQGDVEHGSFAPADSVPGQPDSLPLSDRLGGASTGGLSTDYRTLLYLRIAFADDPNFVVQTESSAYSDLQVASDNILETSYGRMQILPTVTPIIVLPEAQSFYASAGTFRLASDARQVAANMGYSPAEYGHRIYRYSGAPGSFGGFAMIGANPGDVWMRFSSASLLVHELGHNFRLFHSNGWDTDGKASIGPSASTEYDHNFCIMADGYAFNRAGFCSFQKNRIGWLKDSEYVNSLVSGRHRIHALDDSNVDPDKRYAIRIPTPNRGNYWLEYRNNYNNTAFRNGLFLQAQGSGWGGNTSNPQRIDVTYWSKNDDRDSTIPIGWTFSDHEQGIHITPLARDNDFSWIDVQVHHEQDFTNNTPPTATLTASKTNPAVGESVSFSLTNVSDPDGDELRYYWYFDNEVYHNFSWSTITSRDQSWNEAGVYNVIAIVTDMKGGTSYQSIPITVGAPSNFSISGQVLDHAGEGVAGVAVDNGLGFNNANYRATLTNEAGTYTLGRLPAAGYTVKATKDYDNFASRRFSNPVAVGPSATGVDFRARLLEVEAVGTPSEGGGTGQFVISRVQSVFNFSGDIFFRVSYSGDAEEGVDYTVSPAPVNGLYSLTGGADPLTLTVTPIDDAVEEGPEDVTLSLAMGTGLSLVDTQTTKATLLIEDNESTDPRVRAIPMGRHMDENGGTAEVLFIRYGDTTNALIVNLGADSNTGLATYGQDYTFDTGTESIVIPAGSETAVLQVIALDDSELEGFEKTQFRINPGTGYVRDRDPPNIVIDIADDEIPTVTVTTADGFAGEGNDGLGFIRFTRDPVASTPLVVNYGVRGSALHGTDYTQLSGVATIPANAASVDVAIEGLSDALIEGSEEVALRASSSNHFDYALAGDAFGASVNLADKPILTLTGPSAPFSELSPEAGSFTINRVGPTAAITVTIESIGTADGGADFTFPATVDLAANDSSVSFSVMPITDSIPEGDETITLNIVPQIAYGVDVPPSASQTIIDLPIDEWRFAVFGVAATEPEIAGDDADPDGDRQVNLLEFATMSDPLVADLVDLKPEVDADTFAIEYKRRKHSGVTVQCLWTETLDQPASWSAVGVTEQVIEETAEYTLIRASIPVTSNHGFLKLEVTR